MTIDQDIPNASLQTINFAALEKQDPTETQNLAAASVSAGFFYLDFDGSQAACLPKLKDELIKVMEKYFGQSQDVKLQDSKGKSTRGYVKKGTFSAVDPKQPDESFEHLAIGTYDMKSDYSGTLPELFKKAEKLVPDYVATCEHVVSVLLSCYAHILGRTDGKFMSYHDQSVPSDTILALLSYPGKLTHQKHTDLGSLTVLFSDQWGLQVVEPSIGQWQWVQPRKTHAVINVGDALRFLSEKKLYSCVHRVIRDGRASLEGHRYSVAYLLRPADNTVFANADGVEVTAKTLAEIKYNTYAVAHEEQEKNTVLTGGMEQVLGVRV